MTQRKFHLRDEVTVQALVEFAIPPDVAKWLIAQRDQGTCPEILDPNMDYYAFEDMTGELWYLRNEWVDEEIIEDLPDDEER